MSTKTVTETPSKHLCGFCSTGHHASCPGGVLNGNLTEVVRCACDCERSALRRCFDCGTREQAEIDATTWRCVDRDACAAHIEKRLAASPVIQQIREIRDALNPTTESTPKAPQNRRATSKSSGACLHCGEPTKGGLFLPGHDAAYLSAAVKSVAARERTADEIREQWTGQGIGPGLMAKFEQRIVK